MKRVIVFDGNSILNRAFYGVKPLTTKDVYGFINIIKKHMDSFKPDGAVCAFDVKAPTFRHKMYDGYKATRKGMPEELAVQLPYAKEAVKLLGITLYELAGYEADDILGTVSRECDEAGIKCRLVTGDRDSLQLVSDNTSVVIAATGRDDVYTPREIYEKYGVEPKKIIDIKALMGDASDNIPGVAGIGEKTAVKLVFEGGTLDEIYADTEALPVSASVREKIRAGKESAYMSYKLAEIFRSVPGIELDGLKKPETDREGLREFFIKLEFSRLISVFELDAPSPEEVRDKIIEEITTYKKKKPVRKKAEEETDQISIDDISPDEEAETASPASAEALAAFAKSGEPVFLDYRGDTDALVMCGEDIYTIPDKSVLSVLKEYPPVVYDKKEYLRYIKEHYGEDFSGYGAAFDLKLAQYVVNPADSAVTRPKLVLLYLKKAYGDIVETDVSLSLCLMKPLYETLKALISEKHMEKLYYEIELPTAGVLAGMEDTGFLVSREGLRDFSARLEKGIAEAENSIYEQAGTSFNVNSPKQLGEVLFEKMQIKGPKKKKNGYPTDAETLEKLRSENPIIDDILEYRALSKLRSTYAVGLEKVISPKDGRIHTYFNQFQTLTGRLSSAEPNLQNIPVRTELGRTMRGFFIPSPSCVLVDADYSQIELRVLAYLSGDETLIGAFEAGADIHAQTASDIFGVPLSFVTPEMRKKAKAVNFGIIYGIGDYSLAQDIHESVYTARAYIQTYFRKYPKIKEYLDFLVEDAKEKGYASTMFGRIRYIPELTAAKKDVQAFGKRVAMNTPVQGSAADIIKIAMIRTDGRLKKEKLGSRLILQVHDELIIEAPRSEEEYVKTLLKEEMENATDRVRLVADVSSGENWLEAKD